MQVKEDIRELITLPSSDFVVTLDDLYAKAHGIQTLCEDFDVSSVDSSRMMVNPDSGKLVYRPDNYSEKDYRSVRMTKFALGQLCTKLGVPTRYIDKCVENGMIDLASDNINSWLSEYGKSLFVREYDNSVRGILSDRYTAMDTPEVIDVLEGVLDGDAGRDTLGDYVVKGYYVSPERFHARIVQRDMLRVDGEDLFGGIQIDSSDVGRSTLQVRFMIFKQVCTNGLCISKGAGILFEQRHIGISQDDFRTNFVNSISRVPTLIENAQELVESARKDSSDYGVATFSEKELEYFSDKLKFKTKLSDEYVGKVIDMMKEKYSPTRWGLINSLTEVAQDFTLERRVELEKIAGDMLIVA